MSTELATALELYLTARYPGAKFSGFTYLSGGWESDIYAFTLAFEANQAREFIIRLYLGNDGVEKSKRERSGIRRLQQAGYPVPEVLLVETNTAILGRPFIIMEKLSGQSLWPALSMCAPDEQKRLLREFSQILAQLHRVDWRPFSADAAAIEANPITLLHAIIDALRQTYTAFDVAGFLAVADWLDQHKATIKVKPAVVHLDFHANNVFLRDDGRLTVIDWSQLTVSDFRCDLSWTLQIMGDFGVSQWREQILSAYAAAAHQVDDLDYFAVISYVKYLASTIISLRVGPETLGMRSDAVEKMRREGHLIRHVSRRIYDITGITISEVEAALSEISDT